MCAFVITLRRSSVRTQLLKIFSSETTWPLETKLWWNGLWVIAFQNWSLPLIFTGMPGLQAGHQVIVGLHRLPAFFINILHSLQL
jgi:hypothetical protein